jgi:catechol 2,3-dioxygenase-like lactoylglutathione lyase family enzyme
MVAELQEVIMNMVNNVSSPEREATFFRMVHLLALLLVVTSALAQTPSRNALLGQGWGLDHVGVAVRDLTRAQSDYERLGFKVSEGGHFPGGLFNSIIYFGNKTYLELLSVKQPQDANRDAVGIADFAKKHEGAMFLGLNVSSAKDTASYLKTQGFDVTAPDPGSIMTGSETKPPPPLWYTVSTADKPAPGKLAFTIPIFLIEYLHPKFSDQARAQGRMEHPNTAIGIHAVWFAVRDLEAQQGTLNRAGFESRAKDVKFLGANGTEVKAGSGVMVLLAASDKNSPVAKYLSDHDEGIIALSIEVSDLSKARTMAESVTDGKIEIHNGRYGQSFLLPPDASHGVWLEFFHR